MPKLKPARRNEDCCGAQGELRNRRCHSQLKGFSKVQRKEKAPRLVMPIPERKRWLLRLQETVRTSLALDSSRR